VEELWFSGRMKMTGPFIAAVVSSVLLAGCGATVGGLHLQTSELEAGRKSLDRDSWPERAQGVRIFAEPLDVVGLACPDKEDLKKCTRLDEARVHRLESILRATLAVMSSPAFQERVADDDEWFPSPGTSETLSGRDLLAIYPSMLPAFIVMVTDSSTANEAAATGCGSSGARQKQHETLPLGLT
jgi:hypothetical protein